MDSLTAPSAITVTSGSRPHLARGSSAGLPAQHCLSYFEFGPILWLLQASKKFFLVVLGFEFGALCFLGKCSTT
jgi:hypothetical protein